jgi:hypothetical protein
MKTEAGLRFRILAGILIFFGFLMITANTVDPDFYWHLRDGEAILATHTVPRVDTYSYTMAGTPWVDHEWLVESWFAWMWNQGLLWLLDIIFAVIAFIPFVVWLRRYRTWPDLWAIVAGATLFISFLAVKPQVLSYLLFLFVLELLSLYYLCNNESRPRQKLHIFFLPLIFFIWANIHAEFFSGLVLFAIFLVADATADWWRKKKIGWHEIVFPFTIFFASAGTPLINPYGAGLYGEVFRVMFSGNTMRYVQEWQSPLSTRVSFSPENIVILFLLSMFVFVVAKYYKRLPPTALTAGIIFFMLFMKAQRMGPLFLIVAIPVICDGLAYASAEISSRWHALPHRTQKALRRTGIAVSVATFYVFLVAPITLATTQYPAGAVNFLNQRAAQGNAIVLFNYYGWGGYLIWNAPEVKVFIDGRMPHWIANDGTSAMTDYAGILLSPTNTSTQEALIKKWGINTILLPNPNSQTIDSGGDGPFVAKLESEGWTVAYQDPVAIVLVTQTP